MAAGGAHLRTILEKAVEDGVTPGVVVRAAGPGGAGVVAAVGQRQIDPMAAPLSPDTIWDLASLTKPLVTSLLVMKAVAAGRLDLDEPLGAAPAGADASTVAGITVRRALGHASGFPAHLPLWAGALGAEAVADAPWAAISASARAFARGAVVAAAGQTPLVDPPGTRSVYSDLGFILLGDLVERRLGDRLDRLATRLLGPPFGRPALSFRPAGEAVTSGAEEIAATERCPVRKRVLVGEVHDLNAYAMGGVAGHAGLFGTAAGVAALVDALLAAYRGEGPRPGQPPLVDPDVLRAFWTPAGIPGSRWRLGWDGPAESGSLAGDRITRAAVGHLAFTGCSLWIDPVRETYVLMLSNRVHPVVRDDPRFKALRRAANDAALDAIGYSPG